MVLVNKFTIMDNLGYKMVIVNKHESQFILARTPAKRSAKICLIATAGILASIN